MAFLESISGKPIGPEQGAIGLPGLFGSRSSTIRTRHRGSAPAAVAAMSSGVESGTGRITMFRFGSWLLALALALLCLGCSSNQAIKEVVVRDKATGQPMAGVMIVY
ncbi:MAG: hypothetical protein ABIQ72_01275, partial [Usitatibacter sp.]